MTEFERLQAIIADARAKIDALSKVQTVLEEARERLALACDFPSVAAHYREGTYDYKAGMIAMVKVVQELRDMTAERDGLLAENAELKAVQS